MLVSQWLVYISRLPQGERRRNETHLLLLLLSPMEPKASPIEDKDELAATGILSDSAGAGGVSAPAPAKHAGHWEGRGRPFLEMQTIKCMATANSSGFNRLSTGPWTPSARDQMDFKVVLSRPDLLNKGTASEPYMNPSPCTERSEAHF